MRKNFLIAVTCIITPSLINAAQPQPICAGAAQSFLNAATTQAIVSQGCSKTVDGHLLEIEATDSEGTWNYTALISISQDACVSTANNCCVRIIDLNGKTIVFSDESYPNKGWLKRDQRDFTDLCDQLIAVP